MKRPLTEQISAKSTRPRVRPRSVSIVGAMERNFEPVASHPFSSVPLELEDDGQACSGTWGYPQVHRKPLPLKRLAHRKIILDTDSVKGYKAKVPGMVHDKVVHAKTRVRAGNKTSRKAPQYVRVGSRKLPNDRILKVKPGAQHIDRA